MKIKFGLLLTVIITLLILNVDKQNLYHSIEKLIKEFKYSFDGYFLNLSDTKNAESLNWPWNTIQNNDLPFNESIYLNSFRFDWKRIEDKNLRRVGSAHLVGDTLFFLNQKSKFLTSKFFLTEDTFNKNGGLKGLFKFKNTTILYLAYIKNNNCATAKLVTLEENKTLLEFDCLPVDMVDLNGVGGAVLKLSDDEFLLSTGTPTIYDTSNKVNQLAQDDNSYWGKILKLTFISNELKVKVFSKGHRNIQGIAKINEQIYAVEHGPHGGDEINLIIEGGNYGWPVQSFGTEYEGKRINKSVTDIKNNHLPLYSFVPSIGISFIAECPKNYRLYYAPFSCLAVSSMRNKSIFLVIFDKNKVFFRERLEFGSRIRKFFVEGNNIFAVTDKNGFIVGKLEDY
jgi:hypothetical protein